MCMYLCMCMIQSPIYHSVSDPSWVVTRCRLRPRTAQTARSGAVASVSPAPNPRRGPWGNSRSGGAVIVINRYK